MALTERRGADRGRPARDPRGPPAPRRRGDRARSFTRAGLAALGMLSRQPGQPPDEGPASVEVMIGDVHADARDERGDLDALIAEASVAHGVSVHLVRAVVQAESAFDPQAVSPAGAQGLMQLMPATAALMGVSDPLDPRDNVFGGVKYLSQLLDRFGGDVALALAGYNAGPTSVARYRGIPPYGETREYVTRIRGLLAQSTGASFPLPKPAAIRRGGAAARTTEARHATAPRRQGRSSRRS